MVKPQCLVQGCGPTDNQKAMTAKVYKSYRDFKRTLGRLDAAHELAELALLHLVQTTEEPGAFSSTVSRLSKTHGLHFQMADPSLAFRAITLAGIASSHACYESFLIEFCVEIKELRGVDLDVGKRKKGVARHDHIISGLKTAGILQKSAEFDLLNLLMEMFRLVRNEQAHTGRETPTRISEIRRKLVSFADWPQVFPDRAHPSEFEHLSHKDFLLFTHAARRMAELIALDARPSIQLLAQHPEVLSFYRQAGCKALKQFLRDKFALDPADSADLISFLHKNGVLV